MTLLLRASASSSCANDGKIEKRLSDNAATTVNAMRFMGFMAPLNVEPFN
jgi:hypothetical protein